MLGSSLLFLLFLTSILPQVNQPLHQKDDIVLAVRSDKANSTLMSISPIDPKQEIPLGNLGTQSGTNNTSGELTPIASCVVVDVERQKRLNKWLNALYERQRNSRNCNSTVIYRVDPSGGLGNMIRGYFTSMIPVLLYNASFRVISYKDFLRTLFFNPFPNTGAPFYRPDARWREWKVNGHIPFAMQQRRIPVVPGEKQDIYVKTYFDVTQSIKSDVVDTPLSSIGFLPSVMSSSMNRKGEIHSILLRLLFNPAPELCQLINSYTEQFANAFVIGLQLRMGGKLVNAKDPRFLSWAKMTKVVEEVKAMIKKRNSTQPVIVFVSTDSLKVRQYVAPPVRVMYVKEFSIGHTALQFKKRISVPWDDIMKQAIMDMMVLKDCDYLVVTTKSSYGAWDELFCV
ncbi:putative galactokinase [Blastocystis sp. subtype 1]